MLASPNMSAGFSMLESHLEPGATSGEGHLDDSSEQGGFVLEGELSIWLDDAEEPVVLHQRQLPAAGPCAVPLRQPFR